jgi:hypothetical protein
MKQFMKVAGIVIALLLAGCGKENESDKIALKSITVTPPSVTLAVNATEQLNAEPVPTDASDVKFEWSSADTSVATVSETGLVTGKGVGNTTVKVKSGNVEKTVQVEVTALPPTGHPDHGKINLTLNWDDRAGDIDIPSSYSVVAGGFSGDATGTTFTPDYLFDPGELTVIAYAPADNITVEGNLATLASNEGIFSAGPGWFFSGSQPLTVVSGEEHPVTVEMHQQTGLLTIELPLPGNTTIDATLSGAATQIDLETGGITGDPGTVALEVTQPNNKYVASARLLGTVGNSQILTLTCRYNGGSTQTITRNLSESLAEFNSDKKAPLLLPLQIYAGTSVFQDTPLLSNEAPCEIHALDFDLGGEGVAFHDADNRNEGGSNYRNAKDPGCGIDFWGKPTDGGGIGWFSEGEWLVYTLNVQDAGTYRIEVEMKNKDKSSNYHLEIDGLDISGSLSTPVSVDGWHNTGQSVILGAGTHQFKFYYERPCCIFDLRGFRFTYQQ